MKKITKSTLKSMVRKLNDGDSLTVKLFPCKANINSIWFSGIQITIKNESENSTQLLNKLEKYISEFEYYNCNNELGNYASYYLV